MLKYGEFGISFLKNLLISKGASPVYYVASSSQIADLEGKKSTRAAYFDEAVENYQRLSETFEKALAGQDDNLRKLANSFFHLQHMLDFHILSFIKFFDPAVELEAPENYYMEREWRMYGNLQVELTDICRITLPRAYEERFHADVPEYQGQLSRSEDAIW